MLFLVYALGNTLESQCIALMPIATLLVSHAPDLRTIYGFPTHIHAYIGTTRAYLCVQSVNREEKKSIFILSAPTAAENAWTSLLWDQCSHLLNEILS